MTLGRLIALATALALLPAPAQPQEKMRRFVLAAGANDGGRDRVGLHYAISDAEKFADVMRQMGGVAAADVVLLTDPGRDRLVEAVGAMGAHVAAAKDRGRTEVLFYYSGHADEGGLMLGEERVSYREVRSLLDGVAADVRIAVLDACASGAITRIKGGTQEQAFELDETSDARGYAFLTSSSAEETAQESDRIQSSFFTHFLVSGMRGGADVSGDGRVTLGEAYQFAFRETLAGTIETQAGPQHAAYHINLSGTGDIVLTDLRGEATGIVVAEGVRGRLFVQDRDRQLVAEFLKPADRAVTLGLAPGRYDLHLTGEDQLLHAVAQVGGGERETIAAAHFSPARREPTIIRGGRGGNALRAGRMRFEFQLGRVGPQPRVGPDPQGLRTEGAEAPAGAPADAVAFEPPVPLADPWSVLAGIGLGYWVRDDVAVTLTYAALGSQLDNTAGPASVDFAPSQVDVSLSAVLLGASRYFRVPRLPAAVLAHASAAVGSFIAREEGRTALAAPARKWRRTNRVVGAQIGAGADLRLTRDLMVGLHLRYNAMGDFDAPLAGRRHYNGAEFGLGVGWFFLGR